MRARQLVVLAVMFTLVVPTASLAAPKRRQNITNIPSGVRGAEMQDDLLAKALNENNLDGIVRLYSKAAVLYPTDVSSVTGRVQIRDAYRRLLDAYTVKDFKFTERHYVTIGQSSVGWGLWSATLVPKTGGAPTALAGRFTGMSLYQGRRAAWRYVVNHMSLPVPLPQPPPPPPPPAEAAPPPPNPAP